MDRQPGGRRALTIARRLMGRNAQRTLRWLAERPVVTPRFVRARLAAARAAGFSAEQRSLARQLVASKRRLAALGGDVTACGSCSHGAPLPMGRWPGGQCCAGVPESLFDETELAALAAAGTRSRHLRAPLEATGGCAYRGSRGCLLPVARRPSRCLRYACVPLQRELHARGDLDAFEAEGRKNEDLLRQLAAAREAAEEERLVEGLRRAVDEAAKRRRPRRRPG